MHKSEKTIMHRAQLTKLPIMLVLFAVSCRWLSENLPPMRLIILEAGFVTLIVWWVGSTALIRRRHDIGDNLPGEWFSNSLIGFWMIAAYTVAAFWMAMPYADPAQQLLAVLTAQLPISAAAMGTLKRPEDGARSWFGTCVPLIIPVGITAYFGYFGGTYAAPIIILLSLFCGLQLLVRELLQAAVTRAWYAEAEATAQRDARTIFLASASHDIGQPLHSARLFFDQAVRGTDPARRAAAVARAEAAFDTVEHQLEQINSYLRLQSKNAVPRMQSVAIGPLLAGIASRAEALSSHAGPAIRLVESSLHAHADPALLDRALFNLIDNAHRHAKASRLLIGARSQRNRIRLWVIDDGIGVARCDVPRLFADYVRGSDHGDEQRGGFGLGLASVRQIAALQGGYAGIETKWRRGSAFYIDLAAEMSRNE